MADTMTFDERMSGFYSPLTTEPSRGYRLGQRSDSYIHGQFRVTIEDMDRFVEDADHEAALEGNVTVKDLGEEVPLSDGRFNLFRRSVGDVRQMIYRFDFSVGGVAFHVDGRKEIVDEPLALDAIEDMTTLYTRIYRGAPPAGDLWAAGIMRFHLGDLPMLLRSIQTPGATGAQRLAIIRKFFAFAYGELSRTYLSFFHV